MSGISDTEDILAKSGDNELLSEFATVRKFTLGGSNGPSFKVAENLGATPIQITTKNGTKLLSSTIDDGNYLRTLGGAGTVGGIPIVGPAGRTYSKNGKAEIIVDGQTVVSFDKTLLGKNGRIPAYKNEAMSHGPIFTSQKWNLTKLEQKGPNGVDGIKVTYTLPLLDDDRSDEVVDKLLVAGEYSKPGQMEAIYTLEPDENGEVRFLSEIKIDPGEGNTMYLGAFAQHTFLASETGDQLQTNAKSEYAAPEASPELPTGKIIDVQKKHNFAEAQVIHEDSAGALETVLTGYEGTPTATLIRENGLKVVSEAGGAYDGFLLCNKGTGNLMLEPIHGAPNAFANKSENPVLLENGQRARYQYSLSLAP